MAPDLETALRHAFAPYGPEASAAPERRSATASHQRCKLQLTVGHPLLHHGTTGVSLTKPGEAFLPYAERIPALSTQAMSAASPVVTGHCDVGLMEDFVTPSLAQALGDFSDVHQDATLELITGPDETGPRRRPDPAGAVRSPLPDRLGHTKRNCGSVVPAAARIGKDYSCPLTELTVDFPCLPAEKQSSAEGRAIPSFVRAINPRRRPMPGAGAHAAPHERWRAAEPAGQPHPAARLPAIPDSARNTCAARPPPPCRRWPVAPRRQNSTTERRTAR